MGFPFQGVLEKSVLVRVVSEVTRRYSFLPCRRPQNLILSRRASAVSKDGRRLPSCGAITSALGAIVLRYAAFGGYSG